MAELTWVNHASFVIQNGNASLICDPWLEGSVFNKGWNLLSPTQWKYEDFRNITHIYFSHEHPDHFFPPNVQKIPQEVRGNIEVIFQETQDKKVLNFCKKLGFQTRELKPFEWTTLGDGMRVMCGPFPPYDSWLLIDVGDYRIMNLNDCQVKSPELGAALLEKTGKIDVLLSQFSYACWVGNPEDIEWRRATARRALEQISNQMEAWHPRFYIPSASFILFSHEENLYLNDSINRVETVVNHVRQFPGTEVFAMYPGDKWIVGTPHDGQEAMQKYAADYERGVENPHKSDFVTWAELEKAAADHLKRLHAKNNWLFVKLASLPPFRMFPTVSVFLTDFGYSVRFDIFDGLREAKEIPQSQADISMTSGSLAFVLKFDWGFDTLYVNACFRAAKPGFDKFERCVSLALLNNTGRTFGLKLFLDPSFCYTAIRHFFPKLRWLMKRRMAQT